MMRLEVAVVGYRAMSEEQKFASEAERVRQEYYRRRIELPADMYSLAKPVNMFFQTELCRALVPQLDQAGFFPLKGRRILDVGCGPGNWLLQFAQWGAHFPDLCGIDLDENRLAEARRRCPGSDLRQSDATHLPWDSESFDVVSQFVVFTSILDRDVKRAVAAEMMRILKPDGVIIWHDFRVDNPKNRAVRGVNASEIRELFRGYQVRLQSVTLAPPIARALVPFSWSAALLLEKVPFLRTHYLGLIQRS